MNTSPLLDYCFCVPSGTRLTKEEELGRRCERCKEFAKQNHSPGVLCCSVLVQGGNDYYSHFDNTRDLVSSGGGFE